MAPAWRSRSQSRRVAPLPMLPPPVLVRNARGLWHWQWQRLMSGLGPADPSGRYRRPEAAFAALPERIKEIQDFEWGTDNSPEGLQQGLTHCFFVTFASEADRDAYLPHPAHKEFVDLVGPHVEKVTVVDYWTRP